MAHGDRKVRRMRGSRNHGYGNTQKHRGAGSRGGRGMAGSKKHRWVRVSKYMPGYFGSKGFTRPRSLVSRIRTVNVGWLSERIGKLVEAGVASESGGVYTVDLGAAGYGKLLGDGLVDVKLNVKVDTCSPRAREKIEAAGGSVETAVQEESSGSEAAGGSDAAEETGG